MDYQYPPREILPCNLSDLETEQYIPLDLGKYQQNQMSALFSQLPAITASEALNDAYVVKFPEGIKGTLMRYRNGGVGTPIQGEDGKIIAHASLHQLDAQAVMLQAFSVMAIASGQYFLTQINDEFNLISQKIDQIMDFLYGDKKAELIAEISFAKYAHKNFASIMSHNNQRIATISSLQAAKKVAMKDIEFYMGDLNIKATTKAKNYQEFQTLSEDAFQIRKSLELAMQLYVSSSIMECYYAENDDPEYLDAIRADMIYYINKCNGRILSVFSKLNGRNGEYKSTAFNKIDTTTLDQEFDKTIFELSSGENSKMHRLVDSAMLNASQKQECCLTKDGRVYLKVV